MQAKETRGRQFVNAFSEVYKATRLLETLENFSIADKTDFSEEVIRNTNDAWKISSDYNFWEKVLANPIESYGRNISFNNSILSVWVPRVPGLYFGKQSYALRKLSQGFIESVSGQWNHYTPAAKSMRVTGGLGTNMFAPDSEGNRLVCFTMQENASLGIPALINGNVWDMLRMQDGNLVRINNAPWQLMNQQWITRFPSIQNIPKAYLVIDDPKYITINGKSASGYSCDPFSIMEYHVGDATFYDYVYASTGYKDYRKERQALTKFFEAYRTDKGRNGRYLLAADIMDPLFEADYYSPKDLRRDEKSGNSHLDILEEKIKRQYFKGMLLEDVIIKINNFYTDEDDIKRLATYTKIGWNLIGGKNNSDKITELVDRCLKLDKLEELIDNIAIEHPDIIM